MKILVINKIKKYARGVKKAWRKLKYLDRTQLTYYLVTGFIGAFCVFTGGTYAVFTVSTYVSVGNITIAKLSYNLEIDSCTYGNNYSSNCTYNNNTNDAYPYVTAPANTTIFVDLSLTSLNNNYANYTTRTFNTKYAINYSKVNTGITNYSSSDKVNVYYSKSYANNTTGIIGPYGSEITPIRLVIDNNSSSSQNIYLTALGGYLQNTLTTNILEGAYETDITVRTIVLDTDFTVYSTSPSASFPVNDANNTYAYLKTECDSPDATATWDDDDWELSVNSDTTVVCDAYFKKMCTGGTCSDIEIAYDVDGTLTGTSPDNSYGFMSYTCNNSATLSNPTWNSTSSKWEFNVSNVTGVTLCTAHFLSAGLAVNPPKLVTNLIPVVYDETSSKWKMSATTPGVWYDYGEQKWANAVTVTAAKRGTYSVGDAIEMEDILGMWVWIPRYEYKYTNLGTSYAGGTSSLPGGIDINFISGTSTTETSGYIIHPAFRDASSGYTNNAGSFSAYQIGGWDSELTGFWMGKFETASLALASTSSQSSFSNTTDTDPIVKPNVIARRFQAVYYQYSTAQNIGTYHGISTLDTHMVKNSEWGAVAYLSQSTYGKYGNSDYSGANKEVYMNNSSNYYTGRSMGMPASSSGSSNSAGTYEYNVSQNGTGASTTGNIYGIYDMAGGSNEYAMGWLSTASSTFGGRGSDNYTGFSSAPSSHKYWDEYTTTTVATACGGGICYGHGLSETGGWYGDRQYMLTTDYPWFARSGYYASSSVTRNGAFYYYYGDGFSALDNGSRAVLV